ncbi:MAG: diacylglycerol kinase family protein, partial [Gemmatimonadota bacterium]|nr:diacylglycerol kinase family protein [Gemmatimonadota bacterium]
MRRVLLVVNPVATRTREPIERRVVAVMEEAGCQVEVVRTNGPEHTAEAAKAGAQDSADVVAVYGGDGTIMKAVGGIIDHDVPIGLIPGGTGNVLAGNLRLPKDPVEAARIVATGSPRFIDLGEMKQGDLVQYFSVACGSGFDADVMMHTSTEAKRKYGVLAYLARAFRLVSQIRPVRYDITIDGTKHEIDAVSVVVANCGEFIP